MKKIISLCLITIFVIQLVACSNGNSEGYVYYYTNSNRDELVAKTKEINTSSNEEIIQKLIDCMATKSKNKDEVVIKPEYVADPEITINNNLVTLNFESSYYDMDSFTEVMYRAAMVKEITQLDGIDYVEFRVNGEPFMKDNVEIGTMSANDFVDDTNNNDDSVEWVSVTLYYANKSGDKLIKCQRTLSHNTNVSVEKLVVDTLIKGPSQAGYYRTIPSDCKILSISVREGICYLNLSEEFATEMVNVISEIPIYSITNTLCSIDGIDGVKILVNGDSSISYRESISLDSVFEFNSSLVSN